MVPDVGEGLRFHDLAIDHEEALAIRRAIGDEQGQAFTLQALAGACRAQGDLAAAVALLNEGLAIQRRVGDRPSVRWSRYFLGLIAAERGDTAATRAHLTAMLELSQALGDGEHMALVLLQDIVALRAPTRPAEALRLAAAARPSASGWAMRSATRSRAGGPPCWRRYGRRWATPWAEGKALTLEQASAAALRSAADGARETDQG